MRARKIFLPILLYLAFSLLWTAGSAQRKDQVVTLGKDLTAGQKNTVLGMLRADPAGIKSGEITVLEVDNHEERDLFSGYVPERLIGTKAISSAYVRSLPPGEGLLVTTRNISWVTGRMYANAMVTAGIKDAEVTVAAPHEVSGTAALTGIYKAFEKASGAELPAGAKKTGAGELVETGEFAEEVGQETAADYVRRSKERLLEKNASTPEEIRAVLKDVAGEMNITLTERREEEFAGLFAEIRKLNLQLDTLRRQLKTEEGKPAAEKQPDWLSKIIAYFMDLWRKLFTWIGRFAPKTGYHKK
ncbi:MAG: DUF1002 domain-containing protein [Bacillota bacterium]